MQSDMDEVMKGATARVRRQIAVGGDRCLWDYEEPFVFTNDILMIKAWSARNKCITWGVLDSAIDGLRQCAYDQGRYISMSCIIIHAPTDEIGSVALRKAERV